MTLTSSLPRERHLRSLSPHGFHRVVYYEWGEHDNPDVVVCVHGIGRNGRDFDVLGEALARDAPRACARHAGTRRKRVAARSDRLRRADLPDDADGAHSRAPACDDVAWVGHVDGRAPRHRGRVAARHAGHAPRRQRRRARARCRRARRASASTSAPIPRSRRTTRSKAYVQRSRRRSVRSPTRNGST